jgi:protein-L-isoaspartate(D-aspartate) O-methyltransferase
MMQAAPSTVTSQSIETDAIRLQRLNMVESQVRPSDVTDRRVIRAMGQIARDAYVPGHLKTVAYMDEAIPLAVATDGRILRQLLPARAFAKMLQLAGIPDDGVILDIGCATGYSTAVIARVARKVVGVEADAALAERARRSLAADGIANAKIVSGPLTEGCNSDGPYDAIIVNGGVSAVPSSLLEQLKDGGRLVAIVANGPAGKAVVCTRSGGVYDQRDAFDAAAAVLPGFERQVTFTL